MGNEWQNWYGHRTSRGAHRVPRSFAPNVLRFRTRRASVGTEGSLHTLVLALLFLAIVAGIAAGWWQSRDTNGGGWSTEPIEWNGVQPVPQPTPNAGDAEWLDRAEVETDGSGSMVDAGAVRAQFGFCHSGGGRNCVVDGDTIWFQGQNIRIADIDAPETHEPRCAGEQALGNRATRRLHALVNSGSVTLSGIGRDRDRYGRKLRIVAVDGESVGDTLVSEGLARAYAGGRRPWC